MGTGPVASGLLNTTALANIINQAKGTILSRITEWIKKFEGLCEVEQIVSIAAHVYMCTVEWEWVRHPNEM